MVKKKPKEEKGLTIIPPKGELPEVLKPIAEDVGEARLRRIIRIVETFSGPLPSPLHFQQYGRVLRNAPERILRMAEKEQAHRHRIGQKMLDGDERRADRGLIFGFFIFLGLILSSAVLFVLQQNIPASIFLGTGLIGGATSFIRVGRERQSSVPAKAKRKKK